MPSEIIHVWQEIAYHQNLSSERPVDVFSEVELTDTELAFVFGGIDVYDIPPSNRVADVYTEGDLDNP